MFHMICAWVVNFEIIRDAGKKDLPQGGKITLHPGAAVIVEKVSLLQMGISNTSSKVDPGYNGHLLITIFNLGKKTVRIRRGNRFCCLYILRVERNVRPYDKPGKRIVGVVTTRRWDKIRDWLERNSPK